MAQHYIIDTVLDGSNLDPLIIPAKSSWEFKRRLMSLLSKEKIKEVFKYKYDYDR